MFFSSSCLAHGPAPIYVLRIQSALAPRGVTPADAGVTMFVDYAAKDSSAISMGTLSATLIAAHLALTRESTSTAKNFADAILP